MMDQFDFKNYALSSSSNTFVKAHMNYIYGFVAAENKQQLIVGLQSFHQDLKQLEMSWTAQQKEIFFSQFLQHLCIVIAEKKNLEYLTDQIRRLLKDETLSIFYRIEDEEAVTLWIDPESGNTALIALCEKIKNYDVLEIFLKRLEDVFAWPKEESLFARKASPIYISFLEHLLHENKEGYSAINKVWKEQRHDLLLPFIDFSIKHFGPIGSREFKVFWFQIDRQDGNSALMRAALKKDEGLISVLLGMVKEVYADERGLQELFLYRNKMRKTVLMLLLEQGNSYDLTRFILEKAASVYAGKKALISSAQAAGMPTFKEFLGVTDHLGNTPLLLASKKGDLSALKLLLSFAEKNGPLTTVSLLEAQDLEGYTAVMQVSQSNEIKMLQSLLASLLSAYRQESNFNLASISRVLLKTNNEKYTAFELAIKHNYWKIVAMFISTIDFLSINRNHILFNLLRYPDQASGSNFLANLYQQEKLYEQSLRGKMVIMPVDESRMCRARKQIAKHLMRLGIQTTETPPEWRFAAPLSRREAFSNFFGIFCAPMLGLRWYNRAPRSIEDFCATSRLEVQGSPLVTGEVEATRREAVISIISLIKEENSDLFNQISFIRNSEKMSSHDKAQLDLFEQAVEDYYEAHGKAFLNRIKATTTTEKEKAIQAALTRPNAYILIDNGKDLLLLSGDGVFCNTLLDTKLAVLPFDKEVISAENLIEWLEGYFAQHYTLHPFEPVLLNEYPTPLQGLPHTLIFDQQLLRGRFFGLKLSVLQKFLLVDGKVVAPIQLSDGNFYTENKEKLCFRAEVFHDLFFKLDESSKILWMTLLISSDIRASQHQNFLADENNFLTVYGEKIKDLFRKRRDVQSITPRDVLSLVIETHETLFLREKFYSLAVKSDIIYSLHRFKQQLSAVLNSQSTKVAVQLTLLFFPSAVRMAANSDPGELISLSGLLAADTALRILLRNLIAHPKMEQILTIHLGNEITSMLELSVDRVPIVGTSLALYGLIESGKTLANMSDRDPNYPFHRHLFFNNLMTMGLIGLDMVADISFWPMFVVFTGLTLDAIITEGRRMHDVVLNLHDNEGHAWLYFYYSFSLGLGVIPPAVQTVLNQRRLYLRFIDYLDKFNKHLAKTPTFVAVTLPGVKSLEALNIEKRSQFFFEIGALRHYCEARDPFTPNGVDRQSNYTLLVGNALLECSKGHQVDTVAFAKVSIGASDVAGILMQTFLEKDTLNAYSILLTVDPIFTSVYTFNLEDSYYLYQNHSNGILSRYHWISDFFYIDEVIVGIVNLFPLSRSFNEDQALQINIQYRGSLSRQTPIRKVEYLVMDESPVDIQPNTIPFKLFSFFITTNLTIKQNSLHWGVASRAFLQDTKKLVLQLGEKVGVVGDVAAKVTHLFINGLKGIDKQNLARLDIQSKNVTASLGKFTCLVDNEQRLTIESEIESPILQVVAREQHHVMYSRYYLLTPMNGMRVNQSFPREEMGLDILNQALDANIALIHFSACDKAINLSGTYFIDDKHFFSRVKLFKNVLGHCQAILEISISDHSMPLSMIEKHNFSQVNVYFNDFDVSRQINYVFYEKGSAAILGEFARNYRLKVSEKGWLLILPHKKENAETHVFLPEEVDEIFIGKIRYKVVPEKVSLFAVGTIDDSPIDGEALISPLSLNTDYFHANISLQGDEWQFSDLRVKNISPETLICFVDQILSFRYVEALFKSKKNAFFQSDIQKASVSGTRQSHNAHFLPALSLRAELRAEKDAMPVTEYRSRNGSENTKNASWLTTIPVVGPMLITVTSLITLGSFMLCKRFKRPVYSPVPAVGSLLLQPTSTAALKIKKRGRESVAFFSNNEEEYTRNAPLRRSLRDGSELYQMGREERFYSTRQNLFSAPDVNSTIFFLDYSFRHLLALKTRKSANKVKRHKKACDNFFFSTEAASQNTSLIPNSEPKLKKPTIARSALGIL